MKMIILTGGGTAGHVMVNKTLIPHLLKDGWQVIYIGSKNSIEKELIEKIEQVKYYSISTGKLRRYFSLENFKDPFRIVKGIYEAYQIIRRVKPHIIFSGGGFVSVPVVIGGWLSRVPSIIRETDYTCGLANKITIPFAKQVCVTFPNTLKEMPSYKRSYYGPIIREDLLEGDTGMGLTLAGFSGAKPVLLIMGGSQGAKSINEVVRKAIGKLTEIFDVVHLCGKGNVDSSISLEGYKQYDYIEDELAHFYAMADIVVTRSGSNALFEGLVLRKPMLLIPLSSKASRGDQILNSKYAVDKGYAKMLLEEELNASTFTLQVESLYKQKSLYISRLNVIQSEDAIKKQLECIGKWSKRD